MVLVLYWVLDVTHGSFQPGAWKLIPEEIRFECAADDLRSTRELLAKRDYASMLADPSRHYMPALQLLVGDSEPIARRAVDFFAHVGRRDRDFPLKDIDRKPIKTALDRASIFVVLIYWCRSH
jgi:hypothetical protein